MSTDGAAPQLLCRVQARLCALPLAQVIETMRPLVVDPLPGMPPSIRGLSVIRGEPVAVIDLAELLGGPSAPPGRFVSFRVGERRVALAVDSVLGIVNVSGASFETLPPLLAEASGEIIAAVGRLDGELVLALAGARLVPAELWPALEGSGARS